jgi:hypothetical protein
MGIDAISYYDALNNFNYDSSNNELKIAMPFDWNFDRLKKVNLYVHEEISIPTPSPLALSGYNGTINNIDLKPNSLLVYRTNSSKDVVHIMLTKHTVMDLAQKVGENNNNNNNNTNNNTDTRKIQNNQTITNEMTFTLSPSENTNTGTMNSTSMMNMQ